MKLPLVSAAVLLAALCLPFSIAGTNAALGLLTLALLLRARDAGDRAKLLSAWRAEPLLPALAAYAAVGFISGRLGVYPEQSLRETPKDLHRLWSASLFLGAFALEEIPRLRGALALSFGASSLWGIGQVAYHAAFLRLANHPLMRAHGSLHPVTYGEALVISIIGAMSLLIRSARERSAAAAPAFLALAAAALILNQTRSASFAMLGGFAVIAALEPGARKWALRLGAAAVAALIVWELLPSGGRSLLELFAKFDPANPNQARFTLWSVACAMFRDHPWLGTGPGNYGRLFTEYFGGSLDNQRVWTSAHNLYLHQLAERGLIGAAALAVVLWRMSLGAWRAARDLREPETLWAAATVAAFLLMNMTEVAFQGELISTFVLLIWCRGVSASRRRKIL